MQAILITLLCIASAVVYGVVHDQVAARVCVEYFLADAFAHTTSYGLGFLGGLVVCVVVWVRRGRELRLARAPVDVGRAATAVVAACLTLFATGAATADDSRPPPLEEAPITDADRDHWAFRPLVRPTPPAVKDEPWVRTPVDRFILARLEQEGLAPLLPADRATLLRRVSLDLTGLPPTSEEIAAFAADDAANAWERVVDRLLASTAYGEHWAQFWLDLARFAETDGFEHDLVRPEAWKYRDWVIDALNRDMPYDEFVRRQIAGDELDPDAAASAVATGFLLAGPDMPDLNLQEERRHNVLNDMTATVGAVFLGLQMGCAQCHDHKVDPISQADFYRLRAVFEAAELFDTSPLGRVMQEPYPDAPPSHVFVRGDFRRPGTEVEPGFPRICNPWSDSVPPTGEDAASSGRRTALARWLTRPDHPLATRVVVNRLWQQHFGRGLVESASDFGLMGDAPSHPELLDWLAAELPAQGWSWKRLHKLLVTSAVYRQASRPASPEWTAEQTVAARAAWQRSRQADPDNRLLARMNRQRLTGETIRDSMLAAAGDLSERRGGPGVMPPLPEELVKTLLAGQWKVSPDEEDHRRRSIYLFTRRNLRYPLFEAFDRPDALTTCPRRDRSTTAPQALVLLNSEFSLGQAQRLAGLLLAASADDEARIDLCYRRTLGRAPAADELAATRQFLAQESARLRGDGRPSEQLALPMPPAADGDPFTGAAWVELCLAMFNLNEFVYAD